MKDDDIVHPIKELGLEVSVQGLQDLLRGFFEITIGTHPFGLQIRRSDVRSHDDDRILEVDDAAFTVGEAAIIHDLQQNVEHIGMSFLDFVEEHNRVRTATDLLGELAPLFVTDVSGRRADQAGDRMLLLIFRHVNADHGMLVVEEKVSQGASDFGFADTGWTEEDK